MKYLNKKFLRDISQLKLQFIALVSIIIVGAFFYIGLTAISGSLVKYIDPYYETHHLSDALVNFEKLPKDKVSDFRDIPGVARAEGRTVFMSPIEVSDHSAKLLIHTIPSDNQINQNLIVTGNSPRAGEILIDSFFADANGLAIGDAIQIVYQDSVLDFIISGFGENVEHSFNIENPDMIMPDRNTFGTGYIAEQSLASDSFNQLMVIFDELAATNNAVEELEKLAMQHAALQVIPKESFVSYSAIQTTIGNNRVMSLVTPILLFMISSIIIFMTLTRLVDSQRKQIGIMKAIGIHDANIRLHYMYYPILASIVGCLIGYLLAQFLFQPMLNDIGQQTYSLPGYTVTISPVSIFIPLITSLVFGILACYLSTRRILRFNAVELMKPKSLKGSKTIFLEKIPNIWNKLSYHLKLMLRNLSINKVKLFASSVGVILCVVLIITALGFQSSMLQMLQRTDDMYLYDFLVHFDSRESQSQVLHQSDIEQYSLQKLSVQLPDFNNKPFELVMTEDINSHFAHFDENHQPLTLDTTGIMIPSTFATQNQIKIGDMLKTTIILPHQGTREVELKVAQLSAQYTAVKFFGTEQYLRQFVPEETGFYSTIRLGESVDIDLIKRQLEAQPGVLQLSTKDDIKENINNLMKQNNPVFSLFLIVAVILSFGAIYTVSSINIQERMRELATIKVLGYSNHKLYRLIFDENYLITVIAIVIALPISLYTFGLVVNALRSSGQMIPNQLPVPIIIGGILISLILTTLANQLLKRPIKRINMAETIKEFE